LINSYLNVYGRLLFSFISSIFMRNQISFTLHTLVFETNSVTSIPTSIQPPEAFKGRDFFSIGFTIIHKISK